MYPKDINSTSVVARLDGGVDGKTTLDQRGTRLRWNALEMEGGKTSS
jgi:hypothetical protein